MLLVLSLRGGVDEIDDLRDELDELHADHQEIQEALTGGITADLV